MSALSDHSEALVLDWLLTTDAVTRPTAWYVALYTAAPSDSGGGTEVSTGGYTRKSVTLNSASSPEGTTENAGIVTWTASGADFGTVTHMAILDAATSGNFLWHGELTASKLVADGDTAQFDVGNLTLTLA